MTIQFTNLIVPDFRVLFTALGFVLERDLDKFYGRPFPRRKYLLVTSITDLVMVCMSSVTTTILNPIFSKNIIFLNSTHPLLWICQFISLITVA